MKFTQRDGVWYLVDEHASSDACVIAILRDAVELLALKRHCEQATLGRPSQVFQFQHEGATYEATPFSDRNGRLSLRISGEDGSLRRIETEFTFHVT